MSTLGISLVSPAPLSSPRSSVGQVVALGLHSLCAWCDVFESERKCACCGCVFSSELRLQCLL